MRILLSILPLFLFSYISVAQQNPEIFLGDITITNSEFEISNLKNISNNPGYDNQPSFLPDGSGVLFTSFRDSVSNDVALFDLTKGDKRWITNTPGGKYSPTVMPGGAHFSAVWLKPDGEQLLWKFPLEGGDPVVLIPDEVIGYHAWFNESTLYTFVLGNPFTFVEFKLGDEISRTIIANYPGRSIHKIPGIKQVSYVDKSSPSDWFVNTYNPASGVSTVVTETPAGSEDMVWVDSSSFLIGKNNTLLLWSDGRWYEPALPVFKMDGTISRIALSPDRTKIAIVFTAN
jgi:hypothetical protein